MYAWIRLKVLNIVSVVIGDVCATTVYIAQALYSLYNKGRTDNSEPWTKLNFLNKKATNER